MPGSPLDHPERLAALQRSGLMDSPPEEAIDALAEVARDLLGGTVALVSLVDDRREFFKAQVGLGEPWASARQVPLSHSFSQHVVNQRGPFLVEDARTDARVRDNSALDELGLLAYAGVPLVDEGVHPLGALGVLDGRPRAWTQKDVRTLETLAKAVMAEVHLRQALVHRQQEAHARELLLRSLQEKEAALRQALERTRQVVEAAGAGLWELDLATGAVEADARTLVLMDLPAGSRVTMSSGLNLLQAEEAERMVRALEAALRGENGGRYHLEFRTGGRDGLPVRWVESRAQAFSDAGGQATRLAGVNVDITSRKTAEAEREGLARQVRASEARLRLVMDALPVPISFVTADERYVVVNRAYEEWFGITEAQMRGRSVREIIGEAAYALLGHYVHRALAGETLSFEQHGVPYRLGGTRDVKVSLISHPAADGRVEGYVAMLQDVTALRRLEREREAALLSAREAQGQAEAERGRLEVLSETLRANEERLNLALGVVGAGIWEVDLSTQEVLADRRFRELFGLTRDEPFTLEKGLAIIHPEDSPRVAAAVAAAIAGEQEGTFEADYRTVPGADGSSRWVAARGQAFFTPEGKARRFIGTGVDISERKNLELTQARLLKFSQQLIGIVSHDLRTPLSAIRLGVVTLQRREALEPRTARTLERMQSATNRAERMVRDLLDLTQVRLGGGLKIERQPADFHPLARGVVQEVEEAQPGARIRHEARGDGKGAWDADRLQQVVQNLVTNALKYGTPGERVEVSTEGHGDTVTLSVHNRGEPIPPERQAALFQPMQRGVEGVDRQGRSVGLGLFIVRAIVEAHGGTIELTSREGEGTTFRVRLPRIPNTTHQPT